jgi:hypothetical protein
MMLAEKGGTSDGFKKATFTMRCEDRSNDILRGEETSRGYAGEYKYK